MKGDDDKDRSVISDVGMSGMDYVSMYTQISHVYIPNLL